MADRQNISQKLIDVQKTQPNYIISYDSNSILYIYEHALKELNEHNYLNLFGIYNFYSINIDNNKSIDDFILDVLYRKQNKTEVNKINKKKYINYITLKLIEVCNNTSPDYIIKYNINSIQSIYKIALKELHNGNYLNLLGIYNCYNNIYNNKIFISDFIYCVLLHKSPTMIKNELESLECV